MSLNNHIAMLQKYLYKNPSTQEINWFRETERLRELRKLSNRVRLLAEKQCNEPDPNGKFEKYQENAISKINDICNYLGIKFYVQTDPRGCALYLGTNSENNYSCEGVAIY